MDSAVSKCLRPFAFVVLLSIIAIAAIFAVARNEIADYRRVGKFETVKVGDDYGDIVVKIGSGREVDVKDIPSINSFQSRLHQTEPPHAVPVVEGYRIFLWEAWGCRFYVAFDSDGKVIDCQILDSNSL